MRFARADTEDHRRAENTRRSPHRCRHAAGDAAIAQLEVERLHAGLLGDNADCGRIGRKRRQGHALIVLRDGNGGAVAEGRKGQHGAAIS
jgi:hypothetical protein